MNLRRVAKQLASPVGYLSAVNVLASMLGAVQAVIVARILGPRDFGIIAVLAAMNGAVLNFVDVRLTDLAVKLYYRSDFATEQDRVSFRASVLHLCVVGNGLLSAVAACAGAVLGWLFVHLFTSSTVQLSWILEQAAILAIANWSGTFVYLQRLSERFFLIGTIRICVQVLSTSILLMILIDGRSLTAYYNGMLASTIVAFLLAALTTWFIWARLEKLPLRWNTRASALPAYKGHARFVFFGNLLGYAKMFHRSTDALLVAALTSEVTVGLYKFARSVTDNLYVLFDASSQVHTPKLISMLADRRFPDYRHLSTRLLKTVAILTAVFLVLELTVGRAALHWLLAGRFDGAFSAIVVLTIPFFFVTGLQLWVWPVFITADRLQAYAMMSYGAVAVQYGVSFALLRAFPESPMGASVGYAAHYVLLAAVSLSATRAMHPGLLPFSTGAPSHESLASDRVRSIE